MDSSLWQTLGKWTAIFGGFLLLAGAAIYFLGPWLERIGLGELPGDLSGEVGGVRIFFPLATMIVLSIVLTVLVNLVIWLVSR